MPDSDPDPLFGNPASDLIRGALEGGTGTNPGAPWQPPAPEVLESLLPQYEIERMLGRGGMGAVYKGRQISLDRPVAVKILSSHLAGTDPSFVERFKNEARAMAKLSHPGIVAVYDFGEAADGLLYIVMEFVEGTDVHAMIARQGRLHSEHAMAITAHVCDALAYAHDRGIIHRDIKPANIMLRNDGVVKVADFGLAKFHAEGRETQGLTRSGVAMGTPHFVAPEALILGTTIDHRADIYAVGVMLYQMLTGKLPQGLFELPSLQIPGLDPRYDGIIGRALREDREVRYPSVQDMRRDLDAILTQPVVKVIAAAEKAPAALPPRSRPQPSSGKPDRSAPAQSLPASRRKSSSTVAFAMMGLIVLASTAAFYFLVMDRPAPGENGMRPLSQPPEFTPSSTDPAQAAKDKPFVNSLGMKFVPVPGTGVLFCVHETRRSDYAAYAAKNAGIDASWKNPNYRGIPVSSGDDHPVCNVSWDDAKSFCDWLSKEEGRVYRLPTDHEWSMAVGVGAREDASLTPGSLNEKIPGEYTWGSQWPPPKGAGNYADTAAKEVFPELKTLEGYTDGFATSAPVMSLSPNAFGIYDLGGNVWEFCDDFFDKAQTMRTVRGGCWGDGGEFPRPFLATGRNGNKPDDRHYSRGFRCVLGLKDKPDTQDAVVTSPPSPSLPDEEGFTPLLNSIHHEGWQTEAGGEVEGLSFADGVLTINPSSQWPDYYWYMKQTYADFVLRLDYKLVTQNGNSGIPLRVQVPSNSPRKHNYECDVSNSPDPLQASGAFMGVKAPIARAQKDGEWNELEITAIGQRYRVMLNGVLVNDFTGDRSTSGYIGLQLNVATVQYRNIRIKDLAAPPQALPAAPTTWTDTKGRSLTATFKTIASGNVLLEIAGKITPVPLNTLSAESQRLARELDAGDPAKAAKDNPFVNSLGMKFVPVPGTKVLFCIHETRKADYAAFFAATPGVPDFWQNPIYEGEKVSFANDHPVCNIRWQDCRDFCQWLSRKEGRTYRLPTDSEWSFAAGIGDREDAKVSPHLLSDKLTGEFPWGKEWPPPAGAGNLGDTTMVAKFPQRRVIPGYTDGFATTAPVMSFTPNRFGLHDLSGNVWEFCEDWYDDTRTTHVIRGLNFDDGGDSSVRFLSSHRGWCPAPNRHANHGFRVVLERPAKTDAANPSGASAQAASGGGDSREDPAMTELLDFERTLRSHTWLIPDRNWELRFENDHRASIDERVYTTRWHWWVTGPRSLHVQFAAAPPPYNPSVGVEYIFDREMKSFTTGTGKPTGVRRSALKAPEESDLGRSFAPDYAKKLGSSLRPQFPSR